METDRAAALELAKDFSDTASNIQRVAKQTSPAAAQWAFTQWALRAKAVAKGFPRAEEMLFTREALEQASHFAVARYHASLFPPNELVVDLTCGIGSDLIALAERGPVRGYDIDAERLEYARHNLLVHGFDGELILGDCLATDWDFKFAMGDPNRRIGGKRSLDAADFNPSPQELANRMAALELGLIKLSPMLTDPTLAIFGTGVEFVSYGGECREALVFCGTDGAKGISAVRATDGARLLSGPQLVSVDEPRAFFFEADPAAIRAHALSFISGNDSVYGLGDSNGYLTSDDELSSAWVVSYRVVASGRYDAKTVRAKLRELGGGKPIVKSRAKGVDVMRVRNELSSDGSREPIIALYTVGPSIRYAVLEKI